MQHAIGSGGFFYCMLELDNSRLMTHSVTGAPSPKWDKTFNFKIKDIHSHLLLSVFERDKNLNSSSRPMLVGKVLIPLLEIPNGFQHITLKNKNLCFPTKGNSPSLSVEFKTTYNVLKAALFTFTPKEEQYLYKSEKFKRRLFNDNLNRVKLLAKQAEQGYKMIQNSVNWSSRPWVIKAYMVFLSICYMFQLWMVPMALALVILMMSIIDSQCLSFMKQESEEIEQNEAELVEAEENETNVSLNKILQMVQEAFPTIQNILGQIASYSEKIKNTFNFSVPFLSILAIVVLFIITVFLMVFNIRQG